MQIALSLALGAQRRSGSPRYNTVISVDIGSETGTLDLIISEPADYAGTYPIDLTALATAPQRIRVAPAPTGTQALGETLTGRPALWAIAAGEEIEIERRWWKGNGPLLDRGGHPPLNLTYECEWHSDAQEPFRIDERARYAADPENSWSAWQEGDETTPPDPSPFLSGSFVDPATRELWICTPYTTQKGLLQADLSTPAVRSLDEVRRYATINPNGSLLPHYETPETVNLAEVQVRNNALWYIPGRKINLDLTNATLDWGSRDELTAICAVSLTQPTFSLDILIAWSAQTGGNTELRFRTNGRLRAQVVTGGVITTAEDIDWLSTFIGTPSVENPTVVVVGMRRKDNITSVWTNGAQVAANTASNVGDTFGATTPSISMSGNAAGSSNPGIFNALVTGSFFAAYALSDTEMSAVMNHIAAAVGGTT